MNNYLSTWLFAENEGDESHYPSMGGKSSTNAFQNVYWRCVFDFYKSSILTQRTGEISYLFFTNIKNIPTDLDGVNILNFFHENNIEVILLELSSKTPKDWYGAWRNQFYVFDILNYLQTLEGNHIILDSDVFITKDITPIFKSIQENEIIEYDPGYSIDHEINGISIAQMRSLYTLFYDGEFANDLTYKGGEFIGCTSSMIPKIIKEYKLLWNKNYQNYLSGSIKLNEEAHFLSIIYEKIGKQNCEGNKFIKRMWTSLRYDNILSTDIEMALWHLPAEKKFAFQEIFLLINEITNTEDYLLQLHHIVHIPGNRYIRGIRRLVKTIRKILPFVSKNN